MLVVPTDLPGVVIIEPDVYSDNRGCFFETWNQTKYREHGIGTDFVQDNISYSQKSVLRGLHYQWPCPQAKLVQVVCGEVWDVAVDIRRGSQHLGQWTAVNLTDENHRQLFIPEGFAHGFCVLSERAVFLYKVNQFHHAPSDRGIAWNDRRLDLPWPVAEPILSQKDAGLPCLDDIPEEFLPEL